MPFSPTTVHEFVHSLSIYRSSYYEHCAGKCIYSERSQSWKSSAGIRLNPLVNSFNGNFPITGRGEGESGWGAGFHLIGCRSWIILSDGVGEFTSFQCEAIALWYRYISFIPGDD